MDLSRGDGESMTEILLKASELYKKFGAVQANRNVNLEVKRGTVHALIGPNGAGKTTTVNQLSGELYPDRGTISFDGVDITRTKPFKRTGLGLARSFQITSVFENMTVEENMALSIMSGAGHNFSFWRPGLKSSVVTEKMDHSLSQVGLLERRVVKAKHLSHGEKKQLEVGMALSGQPKLLMLDEPMAGMGPGGTVEMSKLIEKLRGRTTILLIEHDMEVVFSLADTITVLVSGETIASGSPDQIRRNEDVRAAYLGED